MKALKRLLALSFALALLLAGCGTKSDETAENTKSTTESTGDTTTTTTTTTTSTSTSTTTAAEDNSAAALSVDVLVMLDYLIEAEELYGRIDDIISQYNDDILSVEDTTAKLKDEQKILNTLVATVNATEWKSNLYKGTRSQALINVLHQLEVFFESSLEGFETRNNTLLYKADTYLKSYCTLSTSLYNDVKRDYQ